MKTILNIAGHGLKRNKTFDPGATGYITRGEHKYYTDLFFSYLKKYEPKGHKVVYHTEYNVYDYGNIVDLAKSLGSNTSVIEWHFDASSNKSSKGGHVIIYDKFKPDKMDLALRDGIKKMVGVRYSHKGHEGINGRNNLANVNRCAKGGVNYRLIELGFGTNKDDAEVMVKKIDEFARIMSEAIYGVEILAEQQQDSMAGYHVVKNGDTLWGIGQSYNVSVKELKAWNSLKSDLIFPGQTLKVVGSDLPEPKPEPKPKQAPAANIDNQIKAGSWIRIPENKLYGTGNSTSPVKSKAMSAQVETINANWKNSLRLKKEGLLIGFARIGDTIGVKGVNDFLIQITVSRLNIRAGVGTKNKITGVVKNKEIYTITDVNGSWGRLKSGKGWINLNYTKKL